MNKLFGPACFPLDKTVKNWKSFLTESLEEIKAKELKAKYPEEVELISAFQERVEPKYVHLAFAMYKRNLDRFKQYSKSDLPDPRSLDDVTKKTQKFDKLLKTGAWDRAAKADEVDLEMKNPDWWIKHDVPWNSFVNYLDLVEKDFGESEKQKRTKAKSDSELVYEDERFYIVSPLSHKASCFFGKGTKWCITMRDSQYWDSYTSQNKFFIFVIDSKSSEPAEAGKIAFAKDILNKRYEEIYDATDDLIDRPEWLLGMWGEEGEKIFSIIEKYADERRKRELSKLREKGFFLEGDILEISMSTVFSSEWYIELKKSIKETLENGRRAYFDKRKEKGKEGPLTHKENADLIDALKMIKEFMVSKKIDSVMGISEVDYFKDLRKIKMEVVSYDSGAGDAGGPAYQVLFQMPAQKAGKYMWTYGNRLKYFRKVGQQ